MNADGEEYGAEEAEDEEEEDAEEVTVDPNAMEEDPAMAGDGTEIAAEVDEESDDGSEDLEAESSGSEDEELEEEVEGEGGEDMEMDGVEKPIGANGSHDAVMAH